MQAFRFVLRYLYVSLAVWSETSERNVSAKPRLSICLSRA